MIPDAFCQKIPNRPDRRLDTQTEVSSSYSILGGGAYLFDILTNFISLLFQKWIFYLKFEILSYKSILNWFQSQMRPQAFIFWKFSWMPKFFWAEGLGLGIDFLEIWPGSLAQKIFSSIKVRMFFIVILDWFWKDWRGESGFGNWLGIEKFSGRKGQVRLLIFWKFDRGGWPRKFSFAKIAVRLKGHWFVLDTWFVICKSWNFAIFPKFTIL